MIESFHWDKHFETGLAEVDEQHHYLVNIINQFGNLLAENELIFSDIEVIFKELADYADYHFQEEEAMMLEVGIDARHLEEHIELHQEFLKDVVSMHAKITPADSTAASHLLDFLTHWLAYHILGSDQNMARQIKAIESGCTPSEAFEAEEVKRSDATEPLLVALNSLFYKVSVRNRELQKFNQRLEEKVNERTKSLLELNLQLEEQALTDSLTGLPNRRHAMRCLVELWEASIESSTPLVCMMLDADHFKEVNDNHGHDAGDDVLCRLATTLQQTLRNDDIVYRLGGDEFFVTCPNTDLKGGMHIAEVLRKAVAALQIPVGDRIWYGSVSIGVAVRAAGMKDFEALMKLADEAVYIAKQDGKNCVRVREVSQNK